MRTRAVVGSLFASFAVLVVGWQAGAAVLGSSVTTTSQPQTSTTTTGASSGTTSTGTTSSGTSASSGTTSSTPTETPVAAGAADGTYTGSSVSTRFGSVQVSVTISGGTITDVTALKLTDADGKSVQISNRAAPVLRQEVLAAQSANVSNVGGATYTTQAYLTSVQSALDQAGF